MKLNCEKFPFNGLNVSFHCEEIIGNANMPIHRAIFAARFPRLIFGLHRIRQPTNKPMANTTIN